MTQTPTAHVIALLGGGDMGGAVARAMLRSEPMAADSAELRVTTRSSRPAWAESDPRVQLLPSAEVPDANRIAVDGADVILLGVRPEQLPEVLGDISSSLKPGALVVSLAAGVTAPTIESHLPDSAAAVCAMPNLPVDSGCGVIGTVAGARVTDGQQELLDTLLAPAGLVQEVEGDQIDVIAAVPGVGPAYVSYLIEAMVQASVEHGMAPDEALRVVLATVRGSAEHLEVTGADPGEFRRSMMHPGNVTDTSMKVLDEYGVSAAIRAAVTAGLDRTRGYAGG